MKNKLWWLIGGFCLLVIFLVPVTLVPHDWLSRVEVFYTMAGGGIVIILTIYGLLSWKEEFKYKKENELAEEIISAINHIYYIVELNLQLEDEVKYNIDIDANYYEYKDILKDVKELRKSQAKAKYYYGKKVYDLINRFIELVYIPYLSIASMKNKSDLIAKLQKSNDRDSDTKIRLLRISFVETFDEINIGVHKMLVPEKIKEIEECLKEYVK
jgi:predicted PurR-regulated permease PerM